MTTSEPSVKKNYIYRLLYEIMNIIAPLITAPYISRVLGADGVGIYSYTFSIMAYFTMFAALGTASYGAREIARERDDKYESSKLFFEIEIMTIFTSAVCIGLWCIIIAVSSDYKLYFLALLPLLLGTMFDISWYYTGLEKLGKITVVNILAKLAGIVCLFVFVRDKDDLFIYILINSLITLAGSLSMWIFLPKLIIKVNLKTFRFKKHFKETLIYFVPTVATSIYTILDKTLIGLITNDSYQNGYYEQATKIVNAVKAMVFGAVNTTMGSRISYLFKQEKYDEIHRRLEESMNFILLLGIGTVFGIWGIADKFVPVFFGEGYEPVVNILCMMAPLIVIIGISNCTGNYYNPAGLRAKSARYLIIGSCINLCLNLCLIPVWGAKGAVIASIVAESIISILYVANSDGYMRFSFLWKTSWKKILSGTFMLLVLKALRNINIVENSILELLLCVIIGMIIYFIMLFLLRDTMVIDLINMIKSRIRIKSRRLIK